MSVAIVNFNAGNIQSVINLLDRLGQKWVLTSDPKVILNSEKVIFPGQGEASFTMEFLSQAKLDKVLPKLTQPFLGICIGMQILAEFSEEGDTSCLGILPGKVKKFQPTTGFKIPQIGWNTVTNLQGALYKNISPNAYLYFIHSYYLDINENFTSAVCDYTKSFSASIEYKNFFGTQYHPEKSGLVGEQIVKNFLDLV